MWHPLGSESLKLGGWLALYAEMKMSMEGNWGNYLSYFFKTLLLKNINI
jgi:hypothetical protein